MDFVTLSNGLKMPKLGYGVFQVSAEMCERCELSAFLTFIRIGPWNFRILTELLPW